MLLLWNNSKGNKKSIKFNFLRTTQSTAARTMPSRRTSSSSDSCCSWKSLFRSILTFAAIVLFSYIFFRLTTTKGPIFYLIDLQPIPFTSSNPSSISYDIEIRNRNKFAGIYYDDLLLSFGNVSSVVIEGFYQGHHKGTTREGVAVWDGRAIGGEEGIRVGLDGRFKYKGFIWWRSGKHGVSVAADGVKIGGDGKLVGDGRIPLVASSAVGCGGNCGGTMVVVLTALGVLL